jgi:hypothetical protein
MNSGRTVFSQILDGLSTEEFARCERRHPMSRRPRAFSAYDHFACLIFAQLTYRESLRDIEACLSIRSAALYHLGIRGRVSRCNLAYANEHRPPALFAEVAQILMRRARRLHQDTPIELDLDGDLYAIDSSLIELSAALVPWARWQGTQAAIKLNAQLLVSDALPAFCSVVPAATPDLAFLDAVEFRLGDYYVFDRGYFDLTRFGRIDQAGAWFVTRAKRNFRFYVSKSRKVDRATGLRCDQTVKANSRLGRIAYPKPLRRIRFRDEVTGNSLVFLTNNFDLPPLVVAGIYRRRWEVELFFRWIKQHLRLRGFYATTPNGIAIQIWTALCAYLLVAIARKRHGVTENLYRVLQVCSVSAFEKVPLHQLFTEFETTKTQLETPKQLEITIL